MEDIRWCADLEIIRSVFRHGRRVLSLFSHLEYGFSCNLESIVSTFMFREQNFKYLLTAHAPATEATIPPEIIIGRTPLVLLKIIPLSAPARTLFAESCLPLICPIKELKPLYTIAITPAEFPKNGPRLVTAFSTEFNRSFGGCVADLLKPSCNPQAPPTVNAVKYVTPVP